MQDVSRRSFVELTVGSLASLPVLAGGLIVAPTKAVAAEEPAGSEAEISNYAIIDVVTPWKVDLVVRDVTRLVDTGTGNQQNDIVQGTAHVTVTSRANGKSYPRKSVSEQFSKVVKTAQSMSDKASSALYKPGGFQQMLSEVKDLRPSTLILWKTDRLARDQAIAAIAKKTIRDAGCAMLMKLSLPGELSC